MGSRTPVQSKNCYFRSSIFTITLTTYIDDDILVGLREASQNLLELRGQVGILLQGVSIVSAAQIRNGLFNSIEC